MALPPPKYSEMGALYLVFRPMELSAEFGDTTVYRGTVPQGPRGPADGWQSPRAPPVWPSPMTTTRRTPSISVTRLCHVCRPAAVVHHAEAILRWRQGPYAGGGGGRG